MHPRYRIVVCVLGVVSSTIQGCAVPESDPRTEDAQTMAVDAGGGETEASQVEPGKASMVGPREPGDILALTIGSVPLTLAYVPPGRIEEAVSSSKSMQERDGSSPTGSMVSGFYLSTTEVTQAQYRAVLGESPSKHEGCGTCPVEQVTWADALRFANALSKLLDREPAYSVTGKTLTWNREASGFRLPTEAEWAHAARAGESHLYVGSDDVEQVAWYNENSGLVTHPAGEKAANAWGLYDMSGNVWEWVWNSYDGDSASGDTDAGRSGRGHRVCRGGSFDGGAAWSIATSRYWFSPNSQGADLGFRIALPD